MIRTTVLLAGIILLFSGAALAQGRDEKEDTTIYEVVVNHEEQYSVWPANKELPLGWQKAGFSGKKLECLAHIEEVWTNMRPQSLRKQMQEMAGPKAEPPQNATPKVQPKPEPAMPKQPVPSAQPQTLDDDAVETLLDELKAALAPIVTDGEQADAIIEKWDAREDLAGKTKEDILRLLFEDVKAVVSDVDTRQAIWDRWPPKPAAKPLP